MEVLRKVKTYLKDKFKVQKPKNEFIEFSDFFDSEKIFNLFGLNNLPKLVVEKEKTWKKVVYVVAVSSLVMLTLLVMISMVIGVNRTDSIIVLADNVCLIAGTFVIFVKLYSIGYLHRDKVREIIATLDQYYPHDGWNQQVFGVSQHLKTLKMHARIATTTYFVANFLYNIVPLLVQLYMWLFSSQELKRTIILQLFTPYDQTKIAAYTILNTITLLSITSGLIIILMTDLLYAELVALNAMELKSVGHMMSEIDPDGDQENAIEEMKKLVIMHDDLLEVSGKIEEVFTGILFIDLFGIIGMMCSLAFLAFAGIGWLFFTKYFMMFLAASWNAFNHCYYGDRLSDSSVEVADDVYGSSWFNGKVKFRKLVLFIMIRAQNPVQLTGLSFLIANLETFDWIRNLTYSYYTVLVTMYNS